jgi:uncharacterized protein YndB with AHSA1/START domain
VDADKPIEKSIYIEASSEEVFEFLTDARKMLRWIGTDVQVEAKPGGIFRVVPNGVDVIRGQFLEVVPHSKVAFTWGFEGDGHTVPAGSTEVEITLRPEGKGTRLQLVHRRLQGEARGKHEFGWVHYLSRIKSAVEGRDAGPDPFADPNVRHSI